MPLPTSLNPASSPHCTTLAPHPLYRPTHWKQTVLYLEDTLVICSGESISGTIACAPNAKNPRDLDVELSYSFQGQNGQAARTQQFRMR